MLLDTFPRPYLDPSQRSYGDSRISFSEDCPKIQLFIEKQLIEGQTVRETRVHRIVRNSLQATVVTAGMAARLAYVRVSLAYSNSVFGIVLASNSGLSFGAVLAWCFLNVIHDKLAPLSPEEEELLRSRLPKRLRLLVTVSVVTAGVMAKTPFAYIVYVYNNKEWLYPLLTLLVDSGYPIYSLHLSAEALLKRRQIASFERRLSQVKDKLISKLEGMRTKLAAMSKSERTQVLSQLDGLQTLTTLSNPSTEYLKVLLSNSMKSQGENRSIKVGRVGAAAGGLVLTVSQMIFVGVLAYHGAKLFTEYEVGAITTVIFVVICNFFLSFEVLIKTSIKTYDVGVKCLRRIPQQSLAGSLYPKIQASLMIVSLGIVALSYSGPLQVCRDNFSGNFGVFMQVTSVMATVLLSLTAMFALTDDIIAEGGIRFGSPEHRQLLRLDTNLQRLIRLLKESPFVEFLLFLKCLPREKYTAWLNKLQLKQEDIQFYLARLRPSS